MLVLLLMQEIALVSLPDRLSNVSNGHCWKITKAFDIRATPVLQRLKKKKIIKKNPLSNVIYIDVKCKACSINSQWRNIVY